MRQFGLKEFEQALLELKINSRKHILIHSSLISLGRLKEHPIQQMPVHLLDTLKVATGGNTNLYMPAFCYDFPKTRICDLRTQITSVGAWPQWFQQQRDVHLSGHPMFSIAGIGPNSRSLCNPDQPEPNSFSNPSTYARLFEEDAIILFVGIDISVATPIVYVESQLNVGYRFLKPFFGKLTLQNGNTYEQDFYHYCYPMTNEYRNDFNRLESRLLDQGILRKQPLGMSSIYAIYAQDLYTEIKTQLQTDPFYLLNTTPKRYYQYIEGQEVPIPLDKSAPDPIHHPAKVS